MPIQMHTWLELLVFKKIVAECIVVVLILFLAVCGARKRRFRAYQPAVAKNANDTDVRKARKAQLKKDETVG